MIVVSNMAYFRKPPYKRHNIGGWWAMLVCEKNDDLALLHDFATNIGLDRSLLFDQNPILPCYDIRPTTWHRAQANGATVVSISEIRERCQRNIH